MYHISNEKEYLIMKIEVQETTTNFINYLKQDLKWNMNTLKFILLEKWVSNENSIKSYSL